MVDIDSLSKVYFAFDTPVQYKLKNGKMIQIKPILMRDCGLFNFYSSILKMDKNSSSDPSIISMSYLEFLVKCIFTQSVETTYYLGWILHQAIGRSFVIRNDQNHKPFLIDDKDDKDVVAIKSKDFENIKRIILYQNILHYDDEYVDPELKKSMQEVDELKSKIYQYPNDERKFAMITAHCGLSKEEQLKMTIRSHQYLFEEVCGEVEFITVRPIALYAGKSKDLEHWVYKNHKDKFDGYLTTVEQYNKSMGGNGAIHTNTSNTDMSNELMKQFSSFNK